MLSGLFEPVEPRVLLSGAFVAGHVLHVNGNPSAANTINVAKDANGGINVSISFTNKRGTVTTLNKSFPSTIKVRRAEIHGGMLDDTVTIDQTAAAFSVNTRIASFKGNDTLTAGDENDVLVAGRGNDIVNSGAGNDKIFGGQGNDTESGGDGNDTLWGGGGDDALDGGAGDDHLGGVLGVNSLTGGEGKDTFVVHTLDGQTNDYNPAQDVLKIVPTKPVDTGDTSAT